MRKKHQNPNPDKIAIAGKFSDFDQFTEFTAAWDLDFRQIGLGPLNATLCQVVDSTWSLARANFDRTAYQRGAAVPNMRTFALLEPHSPGNQFCGRDFSTHTIAVFPKNTEFQSVSKPGFAVYTMSFPEQQLSTACDRLGIPDVTERLSASGAVIQIDPCKASLLNRQINGVLQLETGANSKVRAPHGSGNESDSVLELLVLCLADGLTTIRTQTQRNHSKHLNRALEFIEANLYKNLSVTELAVAIGSSRRSIEYAFRNKFDSSPKTFINSQRLLMAKRDLRSKPNSLPIIEIANRWGFWHMGQFAKDYRQCFGELPSQTREICPEF